MAYGVLGVGAIGAAIVTATLAAHFAYLNTIAA